MPILVVGMDASGNPTSGNHKFVAIVIGTEEQIAYLVRRLENKVIHMNMIRSKKEQNRIIKKLTFNRTDCIAFCIRLERKAILEKIRHARQQKGRYVDDMKLLRTYHYLVWREIRDRVEEFLHQHGCGIDEVVFQCDGDCRDFAKDLGWHHAAAGSAHMLADIVAWANSHGREPAGTVSLDLTDSTSRWQSGSNEGRVPTLTQGQSPTNRRPKEFGYGYYRIRTDGITAYRI